MTKPPLNVPKAISAVTVVPQLQAKNRYPVSGHRNYFVYHFRSWLEVREEVSKIL
jgi:hypothetical protein